MKIIQTPVRNKPMIAGAKMAIQSWLRWIAKRWPVGNFELSKLFRLRV